MEYLDCDKSLISDLIKNLRNENKELKKKIQELEKNVIKK